MCGYVWNIFVVVYWNFVIFMANLLFLALMFSKLCTHEIWLHIPLVASSDAFLLPQLSENKLLLKQGGDPVDKRDASGKIGDQVPISIRRQACLDQYWLC